jgi:hypothetical protein
LVFQEQPNLEEIEHTTKALTLIVSLKRVLKMPLFVDIAQGKFFLLESDLDNTFCGTKERIAACRQIRKDA